MTWEDIIKPKLTGRTLHTHNPVGRSRNVPFEIVAITEKGITFLKQNGKRQSASSDEVRFVADHWIAYKEGRIERSFLAKRSFNTSYLFAVLRFLEEEIT